MELGEARSAVNDMATINSKAGSDKRGLESVVHTMHAEIDDMLHQVIKTLLPALSAKLRASGLGMIIYFDLKNL
jgi:hypothetical protein